VLGDVQVAGPGGEATMMLGSREDHGKDPDQRELALHDSGRWRLRTGNRMVTYCGSVVEGRCVGFSSRTEDDVRRMRTSHPAGRSRDDESKMKKKRICHKLLKKEKLGFGSHGAWHFDRYRYSKLDLINRLQ
jgi:hypothetical protein